MKDEISVDRSYVTPGIVAGVVAGFALDLYLLATLVGVEHLSLTQRYQFVAAGALGKAVAFAEPSTAWLGLVLHYGISIMWGIGYAYAARTTPQLNARPLISGCVFGVVVLLAMQLIEVGANIFTIPRNNFQLFNLFISHTLFFGIPIASIVAARAKRANAA